MTREKNDDIPNIIESWTTMSKPNEPIEVYEGEFILKNNNDEKVRVKGSITFEWLPRLGLSFSGEVLEECPDDFFNLYNKYKVIAENFEFDNALILNSNTKTNYQEYFKITTIKGIITGQPVKGDITIPVEKVQFSIPNLRDYFGDIVKKVSGNTSKKIRGRIKLENDDYTIILDKCIDYESRQKALKENGGYFILYNGEIKSRNGAVKLYDVNDVLSCLNSFITFLNGRQTAALFLEGVCGGNVIWTDYSKRYIPLYDHAVSWNYKDSTEGFNELWKNFSDCWKNDKMSLHFVIHRYIEANNSVFIVDSIVTAQTALELLYNWYIVEQKKIITNNHSQGLKGAANKIRLLLSQLKIPFEIPEHSTNLKTFIKQKGKINDGPDAIVQVRNAIIHTQERKIKFLEQISAEVNNEIRNLAIWYIERILLRMLKYKGKYNNRCSSINTVEAKQ
ncbi:MAG TPA: hypothetical protein VKX35_00650 [Fermentimonas sp.]|nr:hypothetical protein [Fermentimonas sp.]